MLKLVYAMGFTIALSMISLSGNSQSKIKVAKNEFGISLAFNRSLPRTDFKNGSGLFPANVYSVKSGSGFDLGLVYQRMLTEKFHLRVQPNLTFSEVQVLLNGVSLTEGRGKREAVIIELPVNLVFEDVSKKIGPSFSLGAKYGYDIAANSRLRQSNPASASNSASQISLDASIGLRFHFDKFNFKPELVYSRGLVKQSDLPIFPSSYYDNFNIDQLALRLVFYGANSKKR